MELPLGRRNYTNCSRNTLSDFMYENHRVEYFKFNAHYKKVLESPLRCSCCSVLSLKARKSILKTPYKPMFYK